MRKLTNEEKLNKRMEKKELNIKFYNLLDKSKINLSKEYINRIKDCGSFLEFLGDKNLENFKLSGANFCGNRFCPHCSFNKSRRDALEFNVLLKYIKLEYNYNFVFLTLTAPNVKSNLLNQELKNFSNAFNKLVKYKEVNKVIKGYIRKLELTYNKDMDTYHPHYHVLIAVNKTYFTDIKQYINRAKWLEFWKKAKGDENITQLDIRKVTNKNGKNAALELSKYISKDSDYLYSKEVFEVFYKSLKGKRFFTFNGIFKFAHKMFKNGDLDSLKEIDDIEYIYKVFYIWKNSSYNLEKVLELSDKEREKYNFKFTEDLEID